MKIIRQTGVKLVVGFNRRCAPAIEDVLKYTKITKLIRLMFVEIWARIEDNHQFLRRRCNYGYDEN